MKLPSLLTFILVLAGTSCVDRLNIDIGSNPSEIVIDGFISDEPGPYTVKISKAFDIQSKLSFKSSLSAKRVIISDNTGSSETLREVSQGTYETNPAGIRGVVGNVYKVKVELLDGRVYESVPDTLLPTGRVDNIYFKYREGIAEDTIVYHGFDTFFDASTNATKTNRFLWKFTGTYKIDTNPELYDTICADGRCPKPLLCSGYTYKEGQETLTYVRPCSCCECWVNFFNTTPIVSDNLVAGNDGFKSVLANYIPITQWTFMYQVHVDIAQMSLSQRAYSFWKAAKSQKNAATSLFQPISGKVPGNIIQTGGRESSAQGLFFASSVTHKSTYLTRYDLPKFFVLPPVDPQIKNSCTMAFPNSSTVKPSYWLD